MRFGLIKQHHDFFHRHHYLECEDLLSENEVKILKTALEETLAKRVRSSSQHLEKINAKELYLAGLDGWRDDSRIKKVTLRSTLAEIASQLFKVRSVRIAYDQMIYASNTPQKIFDHSLTLQEMGSIQKVIGGLMLNLAAPSLPVNQEILNIQEDMTTLIPLPRSEGSGIFFSPNLPLSLDYLTEMPHISQLLIVYTEDNALYIHNPLDLHRHALKKMGYGFGDHLRTTTHPIIYP